jgi:hypothetical protein
VQWDSKDGLSGWGVDFLNTIRGIKKELPSISEEAKKVFADIEDSVAQGYNPEFTDDFVGSMELADESLIAFLQDTNYGTKDLESYKQYLINTGKQISTFAKLTKSAGNVIKSFGAALGSMAVNWAIGEVIGTIANAIDQYVNRVEYAKERLEEFNSTVSE